VLPGCRPGLSPYCTRPRSWRALPLPPPTPQILTEDPAQRITLTGIKHHPWFLRYSAQWGAPALHAPPPPARAPQGAQTDAEVRAVIQVWRAARTR
jgi:hypothetical protein